MRQLLMLAAVAGLAVAKPGVYREKEDFQFSRSSTDEGSKSGYYGAQRGNMGGNYERAHNMDPLAQNQMSGLVRTVEGELGDGAKQNTGSVFSSANSRGVYGSGNYDLSNLAGRNFQEGESHGLQSHSSLTSHLSSGYKGQFLESNQAGYGSSQSHNSGYSHAHGSRYGGSSPGNSAQALYPNSQGSDSLKSTSQFEDRTLAQNSGYSQVAGYQSQAYDQDRSLSHTSNGYGSNIHSRLVSGNPVRIIIRPGTKVVVPVAAQTYDASRTASEFDQNAINSETEVFNSNGQHVLLKPTTKQYETSYNYRKEWEKHDTRPVVGVVSLSTPTENPYPANSELYENAQAQTLEQQRQSASRIVSQNHHSGYNLNSASSSQSRQADSSSSSDNAQHHSSDANAGYSAYNEGSNGAYNAGGIRTNNRKIASGINMGTANGLNQIEDSNTKPKSYESKYSYHKSWEHQGDPYVIKPAANGLYDGQVSGKLTDASLNQGVYGSHQYGSQHQSHHGYSSNSDCDEHGHIRVARSPSSQHHQAENRGDVIGQEDFGQQTQQQWGNHAKLDQQTQTELDNLEELGQQSQNKWDQFGQQTENKWDKLQDEGQQTQILWGQQETQKQGDQVEDFGQQTQNQWDQQNVGQQTQNTWDKLQSEPQRQTELGQQTQDQEMWTIVDTKPSGPDSSRQDNHGMNMDHQIHQSNDNTFRIVHSSNDKNHNTESHSHNKSTNHHVHTIWDEIRKEEIGQENEHSIESDLTQIADLGQQIQVTWSNIDQNKNNFNSHQKTEDKGEVDLTNSEQNDKFFDTPNPHPWMYNQVQYDQENRSNSNQYFGHNSSSSSFSGHSQEHSTNTNSNSLNSNHSTGQIFGSSVMSLWDKLDNIEKKTILSHGTDDKVSLNEGHQGTSSAGGASVQSNVFNSYEIHPVTITIKPQPLIIPVLIPTPSTSDQDLPHDIGRGDIESEISSNSYDIGRGDIEPENSSNEQSKPVDGRPYKTPEDIETLSITKESDKVDKHEAQDNRNKEDGKDLSVLSLDQQDHSELQDKDKQSVWQSSASVLTVMNTTQSNNQMHLMHHNEHTHHKNEETESHHIEQQFENQNQQNLHQQTNIHQVVDSQENQHANTDQQLVDFGAEQMEQKYEVQNIGQSESFQQENKKHEVEELSQQNEQFDQVSLSGWKPDDNKNQQEHKLENWGQENLQQQSQSGWTENMDQQVQTAWKPTDNLQQQSKLTDTIGPKDLSQQVQLAWNPTENLHQYIQLAEPFAQPIEGSNQQVQTALKPAEDLNQQSQMTDTFSPQINQNHKPEVIRDLIVPKKVTVVDSPPETESVTTNPGFWKSVGSKFTSAKDKVSSWFSS